MKRVLVVEDDLLLSMITEKVVSYLGYEVCGTAVYGAEAIEKAINLKPDVIVCDYQLKGKLTGLDVVNELGKLNLLTPVIILSGSTDSYLFRDAKKKGYMDFLKKPFIADDLSIVLKKAAIASDKETVVH